MNKRIDKEKRKQEKKSKKQDFTVLDLPHNRFQVFFDLLKTRYEIFLMISGMLFMFLIPFVVLEIVITIFSNNAYSNYINETISLLQYQTQVFQINLIFGFLEIIALFIFCVGLSGISRIIKRLVFYESIQFKEDFVLGIKNNFVQNFIVFLIFGVIYFISRLLIVYQQVNGINDFLTTILLYLPSILGFVLILPILIFVIIQNTIYSNKFNQNIKNGAFFYFKTGPITLGVLILLVSPFLLLLIRNIYSYLICLLVLLLIYLPLAIVIFHIYSMWVFDKFLNKYQFQQIYDKGIYRIKKETNNDNFNNEN